MQLKLARVVASHRVLLLLLLLPLSAAKRLYSPSLTLSTSLAALAVLPLCLSLAFDTITKQQLRIYGWQLLGFVLLLIIVIGTNSDILGAPTPRLSELICCPGTESSSPPLSLAPLPRYRDSMASNVAYAGLLILEKGNIFSTAADRLLFSIIVLAWTGLVWPVPCLGFGLDSVPFCRKLLLTTEAAVRHKLGVEFAACFTFFSSALLLPLTSPASFGFHFFHFYSPL